MLPVATNIAVDPTITGNLQGLKSLRVDYQIALASIPLLMAKFPLRRLTERVEDGLKHGGIKLDNQSDAVLMVGVAVEPSDIPQFGGISALYAVEIAVRESVSLPRTANDMTGKRNIRTVDTWRNKTITGILLPQSTYDEAASLLFAAVIQQIEGLLVAWHRDQGFAPQAPSVPDPDDEPPIPIDPSDPAFKLIKAKLEQILSGLAQGNEGSAQLERFDVNGSVVEFVARVRHRHTTKFVGNKIVIYDATTRASGSFDITKPASLNAKVCVDKPEFLGGGQICQELSGIGEILPVV